MTTTAAATPTPTLTPARKGLIRRANNSLDEQKGVAWLRGLPSFEGVTARTIWRWADEMGIYRPNKSLEENAPSQPRQSRKAPDSALEEITQATSAPATSDPAVTGEWYSVAGIAAGLGVGVVCAACLRRMDPAVMAAREAEEAQRVAAEAERERQDELLRREALAERIQEWIEETYVEVRRYVPEDWVASSTAARLMAQVMVRYAEELGPLDRGGDLGHPEVLHDLKMVRALVDILIRAGEFQTEQSRVYLEHKRAKMAEQQQQAQQQQQQAMRMTVAVE